MTWLVVDCDGYPHEWTVCDGFATEDEARAEAQLVADSNWADRGTRRSHVALMLVQDYVDPSDQADWARLVGSLEQWLNEMPRPFPHEMIRVIGDAIVGVTRKGLAVGTLVTADAPMGWRIADGDHPEWWTDAAAKLATITDRGWS